MRKVILFCAATLFSLLSFAQESDADIVKVGDNIPGAALAKANWLKFRKYSGLNIKTTRISVC